MQEIYIYGGSGHGLVVADIARACGYKDIIFIDDNIEKYMNFEEISIDTKTPIIVAIGDNDIREEILNKIKKLDMNVISLIHPSAIISQSANIKKGTVVMPHVVVNAYASIGEGCILNTSCVVEHENHIGDFVHLSPHVSLAGNVTIARSVHIGISSALKQGVYVGESTTIGMGSVVLKDLPAFCVAYGNPCCIKEIDDA